MLHLIPIAPLEFSELLPTPSAQSRVNLEVNSASLLPVTPFVHNWLKTLGTAWDIESIID